MDEMIRNISRHNSTLTLFNMTGLDPSTVWPLCHMRHVGKDDFRYFGSSGPLYRMTPMSHETCWHRRLSLFRIVFDQSPPPHPFLAFLCYRERRYGWEMDMGHNKLMIPWAIKSVIIWYDLCHIWHCFLVMFAISIKRKLKQPCIHESVK
jgi:hypothetical protein